MATRINSLFSVLRTDLSFSSPYTWTVLVVFCLAKICRAIVDGYKAFLSLGPGGTPSTPLGYFRVCLLGLVAISDPFKAPKVQQLLSIQQYFLPHRPLPSRSGHRPQVAGIAPQRQMTQRASREAIQELKHALRGISSTHKSLVVGTSCREQNGLALFLSPPVVEKSLEATSFGRYAKARGLNHCSTCLLKPEIAHIHDVDGSMHLTLHPSDVKHVLERGWGQRHPLVGRWVPEGFVLVFAPRNKKELDAVLDIVHAAVWWVSGNAVRSRALEL